VFFTKVIFFGPFDLRSFLDDYFVRILKVFNRDFLVENLEEKLVGLYRELIGKEGVCGIVAIVGGKLVQAFNGEQFVGIVKQLYGVSKLEEILRKVEEGQGVFRY